jgi:transposase-like protein
LRELRQEIAKRRKWAKDKKAQQVELLDYINPASSSSPPRQGLRRTHIREGDVGVMGKSLQDFTDDEIIRAYRSLLGLTEEVKPTKNGIVWLDCPYCKTNVFKFDLKGQHRGHWICSLCQRHGGMLDLQVRKTRKETKRTINSKEAYRLLMESLGFSTVNEAVQAGCVPESSKQ